MYNVHGAGRPHTATLSPGADIPTQNSCLSLADFCINVMTPFSSSSSVGAYWHMDFYNINWY